MDIVITGVITKCLDVKSGISQSTGKSWMRASFIMEHEHGQYPRSIRFDVMGEERIKQFGLREGDEITAHLNIDCHEYNGNYYNSIDAWRIERNADVQEQQYEAPQIPDTLFPENDNSPF